MKKLADKKILFIICGGIAAYKSLELIRLTSTLLYGNNQRTKVKRMHTFQEGVIFYESTAFLQSSISGSKIKDT